MEKLGENIRFFREKLGWTQQELADKINVSRTVLSKWENAYLAPDIHSLIKLSAIFKISLDGLVEREKRSNLLLQEIQRSYSTKNRFNDEEMDEIVNYLKMSGELKEGLLQLSRMTKRRRRAIEEIIKVTFRELLSK